MALPVNADDRHVPNGCGACQDIEDCIGGEQEVTVWGHTKAVKTCIVCQSQYGGVELF